MSVTSRNAIRQRLCVRSFSVRERAAACVSLLENLRCQRPRDRPAEAIFSPLLRGGRLFLRTRRPGEARCLSAPICEVNDLFSALHSFFRRAFRQGEERTRITERNRGPRRRRAGSLSSKLSRRTSRNQRQMRRDPHPQDL